MSRARWVWVPVLAAALILSGNGGVRSVLADPILEPAITIDDLDHIKFIQYSWSLSTDVDPFTALIPMGTTVPIEMTVHAVRSAFHSDFVNDELAGMSELCLTNSGDESTRGLGVVGEVEVWTHDEEDGKGYGRWNWAPIQESVKPLLVREVQPAETVCFPYDFRLTNHESPDAHYRVVFQVSDSVPSANALAVRRYNSEYFEFPSEPTQIIERDATAQVSVQVELPEGFAGFGQFSLGTLHGTETLHATLHPENLDRCGSLLGWNLKTFLTLSDSLMTLNDELNPSINSGLCPASPSHGSW